MSRSSDSRSRLDWRGRGGGTAGWSPQPVSGTTMSSGTSRAGDGRMSGMGNSEDEERAGSLRPYSLEPLPYRPYLHPYVAGLAFPDFYPATTDQPEFTFDTQTTRDGLQSRNQIASESFSVHNMIYERLSTPGVLSTLTALLHNVTHVRLPSQGHPPDATTGIEPPSFRPPNRVTLNDLKLGNYVKQLADPAVPLHRLARSVPHGSKGERLLDMLWLGAPAPTQQSATYSAMSVHGLRITASASASSGSTSGGVGLSPAASIAGMPTSVPIERAVWFIRVVGASEIQSAKNRSMNYTAEWTGTVVSWLQRQLNELSTPVEAKATGATGATSRTQPLHATSPMPGMTAALSSPITAGVTSPSSGPSSPVQTRALGHSNLGRSSLWHASPGLPITESASSSSPNHQGTRAARTPLQSSLLPRWISKWTYSLTLVRALLTQQLLDARILFMWLADSFKNADVTQAAVLLFFVEEALEDMLRVGPAIRAGIPILKCEPQSWWPQLVSNLCDRLREYLRQALDSDSGPSDVDVLLGRLGHSVKVDSDQSPLSQLCRFNCQRIWTIIVQAFDLQPYLFVHPVLWARHAHVLKRLVLADDPELSQRSSSGRLTSTTLDQRLLDLDRLQRLCERALNGPSSDVLPARSDDDRTSGCSVLESLYLGRDQHIDVSVVSQQAVKFFRSQFGSKNPSDESPQLYPHIKCLLTWACRSNAEHHRLGHIHTQPHQRALVDGHRPFVAVRVIEKLVATDANVNSAAPSALVSLPDAQMLLMRWFSEVDEAQRHPTAPDPTSTFSTTAVQTSLRLVQFERLLTVVGELERLGIFSFSKYIQRLAARGLIPRPSTSSQGAIHSTAQPVPNKASDNSLFGRLLRALPLHHETDSLLKMRRLAIYGPRTAESREEAMERRAYRELQNTLSWLGEHQSTDKQPRQSRSGTSSLPHDDEQLHSTTVAESATTSAPTEDHQNGNENDSEMGALFSDDVESEYDVNSPPRQDMSATSPFLRCSRFTQVRLLRGMVYPYLQDWATLSTKLSQPTHLAILSHLLLAVADFGGLARVIIFVLRYQSTTELLCAACNIVPVHLMAWQSLDVLDDVLQALEDAYTRLHDESACDGSDPFQIFQATSSPRSDRAAQVFAVTQCAWACVRLEALDADRFFTKFSIKLAPQSVPVPITIDCRTYFDDYLKSEAGETDATVLLALPRLDDDAASKTGSELVLSAFRHIRTASIAQAARIATQLLHFCQGQMITLDAQVNQHGHQLWSTGTIEDATEAHPLGQGRVSFRAHQRFIQDLVGSGVISAQTALEALLVPQFKAFASWSMFTDDIVSRTGLATALSFTRSVLLVPATSVASTGALPTRERTLLLQQSSVPLLAQVYTSLVRAGAFEKEGLALSDVSNQLAKSCAALQQDLQADAGFRAAVAKGHVAFIKECRAQMREASPQVRDAVIAQVASLVGIHDFQAYGQPAKTVDTASFDIDTLTVERAVSELALTFECASRTGSAKASCLPSLRTFATAQYAAICLFRAGRLIDHAFEVGPSQALLSTLLEAGLAHAVSAWTQSNSIGHNVQEHIAALSKLLGKANGLSITVNCSATTDEVVNLVDTYLRDCTAKFDAQHRDALPWALGLLRQSLRTSSFWTTLARHKCLGLTQFLLDLVPLVAMDEALSEDVFGTFDLLLSELPNDAQLRAAVQNVLTLGRAATSGVTSLTITQLPLPRVVQDRLAARMPIYAADPLGEGLLYASTTASALKHGRYTVLPNKVWEHLEFIPQPETGRSLTTSATTPKTDVKRTPEVDVPQSRASVEALAGPGHVWLSNGGSLSLVDFGARRTNDLIVVPAESMGSCANADDDHARVDIIPRSRPLTERSYGDGVGIEPLKAGTRSGVPGDRRSKTSSALKHPLLAVQDSVAPTEDLSSSDVESDEEPSGSEPIVSRLHSQAQSVDGDAETREDERKNGTEPTSTPQKRKRLADDVAALVTSSSGASDDPTPLLSNPNQASPKAQSPTAPSFRSGAGTTARRGRSVRGRRK